MLPVFLSKVGLSWLLFYSKIFSFIGWHGSSFLFTILHYIERRHHLLLLWSLFYRSLWKSEYLNSFYVDMLRSEDGKIGWLDTITCCLDECDTLPLPSQLFSTNKCRQKMFKWASCPLNIEQNKSKFIKINIRKCRCNNKNNQEDSNVPLWGWADRLLCGHSEVVDGIWKGLVTGPTEPEHVTSHTPLG